MGISGGPSSNHPCRGWTAAEPNHQISSLNSRTVLTILATNGLRVQLEQTTQAIDAIEHNHLIHLASYIGEEDIEPLSYPLDEVYRFLIYAYEEDDNDEMTKHRATKPS